MEVEKAFRLGRSRRHRGKKGIHEGHPEDRRRLWEAGCSRLEGQEGAGGSCGQHLTRSLGGFGQEWRQLGQWRELGGGGLHCAEPLVMGLLGAQQI